MLPAGLNLWKEIFYSIELLPNMKTESLFSGRLNRRNTDGMWYNFIFFLLILSFFSCAGLKKKDTHKTVSIVMTEMYCGGAAPPEELLKELETPKPMTGREVEIFPDPSIQNKPLILMTDSLGEIRIPRNLGNKVYLSFYSTYDLFNRASDLDFNYTRCYTDFIIKNLVEIDLKVKEGKKEVKVFVMCNPCVPPAP